ncbi:MAG: nucleoside phosphorylase, partial [Acetobacteraceae bacterium]|nr:nucleoside phosphorylase [Acetobacteraceae bacterium]
MTVIVATGMRAEAALLPPGVRPVVGGGDPTRLQRLLDNAAEGATAVLSFGIAGGLLAELEPGALVVATRVRAPGGAWSADAAWAAALVRSSGARFGVV